MPHSAPAETLHDILRLHDTQAVLALCVVVRAQFCREPCEKIMNIYIADCTIMSYLLGICLFIPALLIFHEIFRSIMGKMLKRKIGRFSRDGGKGRAEICHQGEKSASTFSRQEKYDKMALAAFGRFR